VLPRPAAVEPGRRRRAGHVDPVAHAGEQEQPGEERGADNRGRCPSNAPPRPGRRSRRLRRWRRWAAVARSRTSRTSGGSLAHGPGRIAHSRSFQPRRREEHEGGPASSKVRPRPVMAVHRRGATLLLAGPLFAFFASSRFKEPECATDD
jgi:hypothetical protein